MSRKKNPNGDEPTEVLEGRETQGVLSDEQQARHRSDCDYEPRYFWGTESAGKVCNKVFRCACGATEQRVDAATGEILKEEMA